MREGRNVEVEVNLRDRVMEVGPTGRTKRNFYGTSSRPC